MKGIQQYRIDVADDQVLQIRGYKLLHMNSEREDHLGRERWINLRLFYSTDKEFVLVIAYNTEVSSPHEREVPHVHVDRCGSWRELARALDTYDFMQHVNLDYYCGGHCALIEAACDWEVKLRHRFRASAMAFLRQCLELRSEWRKCYGIDMW